MDILITPGAHYDFAHKGMILITMYTKNKRVLTRTKIQMSRIIITNNKSARIIMLRRLWKPECYRNAMHVPRILLR